jgi:enamine deaminase RidA (YjgF/YER057c/UK114 family)
MATLTERDTGAEIHANDLGRDIVLLTWTGNGSGRRAAGVAEAAYAAMAGVLRERGCVALQERVFGSLEAAPELARARARALADAGGEWLAPPTFLEGSPIDGEGIAGIHVVAARGKARPVGEGGRVYGTVVEGDAACFLGLSDVGRRIAGRLAPGPAEDAGAAITAAEVLLAREGFSFRDVARTWFYLRDILDWYGPFNAVRNAAFRRMGLVGVNADGKIPASTGIKGRNARGGWCTLDLVAIAPRNGARVEMNRLHNRRQNEATEYGSAFARGMEVVLGDARYVFVSGTAAIDGRGATVHAGDFEAQARYTLDAVSALLEGAGARLSDVRQGTAFLKDPRDERCFAGIAESSPLAGVPLVTTVADVCRPDLLFEIDATAVVPLGRGTRR